jgi:predicted NBD/HSP70 family sugar kinase
MSNELRHVLTPVNGQNAVRRANLARMVELIVGHSSRSRADLAVDTGMNKTTVSSLISELLDLGLVREAGREQRQHMGRPSTRLVLAGEWIGLLGLEVNVNHIAAHATDLVGETRYQSFRVVDNHGRTVGDVLDDLAEMVSAAVEELAAEGVTVADVTVALPGLVDDARGSLLVAPNLGWSECPVVDLLRERVDADGLAIHVGNDANLAAFAELHEGRGHGGLLRDFIYVGCPKGLGSGIVVGGEVLGGTAGFVGEIGHITVDPGGPHCTCGNRGCLERLAGLDALLERAGIKPERESAKDPRLLHSLVAARALEDDAMVMEALAEMRGWLAIGLSSAINVFHPEAIVVGGYLAPLAGWFLDDLAEDIQARVLAGRWRTCELLVSDLGAYAASRGAAARSRQALLGDPAHARALVTRR